MSAYAYTEDQLVEQPAVGLFAELDWQTMLTLEETFGTTGTLLRETKGELALVSRLSRTGARLDRLNAALLREAIAIVSISPRHRCQRTIKSRFGVKFPTFLVNWV